MEDNKKLAYLIDLKTIAIGKEMWAVNVLFHWNAIDQWKTVLNTNSHLYI